MKIQWNFVYPFQVFEISYKINFFNDPMWKVLFSCFLQSSCQQEYCTCFARKVASSQCPKVFNYSKIIVFLLKLLVNIYWHGDKLNAEAKTCDLFGPSWLYSTRPARPHCPKSNLILCVKTKPITVEAGVTEYSMSGQI